MKSSSGNSNSVDHINDVLNSDVASSVGIPSAEDLYRRLKINDQMTFVQNDPFISNPFQWLGQVIIVRKQAGQPCTQNFNDPSVKIQRSTFPILKVPIGEKKISENPVMRSSIVVDQKLSAQVSFLSYLNGQFDQDSFFSLMVFDQLMGIIDFQNEDWSAGVEHWMKKHEGLMQDPNVCYIYAVTGFVQKNIVRKKYIKYNGDVKGGAFGANINGKLATSTEDYSLDILFGLDAVILRQPDEIPVNKISAANNLQPSFETLGTDQKKIFSMLTGKRFDLFPLG